jgi:hypothetical protein
MLQFFHLYEVGVGARHAVTILHPLRGWQECGIFANLQFFSLYEAFDGWPSGIVDESQMINLPLAHRTSQFAIRKSDN